MNLIKKRSKEELQDGIIVYQNFLDPILLANLLTEVHSPVSKWVVNKSITNEIPAEHLNTFDKNSAYQEFPTCEEKYNIQCVRMVLDFGNLNSLFEPEFHIQERNIMQCLDPPFQKILKVDTWQRIKINKTFCTDKIVEHGFHIDRAPLTEKTKLCTTAVLHLDNSNGYTKFAKNDITISSKENQLIVFPAHLYHTGTTCTDSAFRTVINFNFY